MKQVWRDQELRSILVVEAASHDTQATHRNARRRPDERRMLEFSPVFLNQAVEPNRNPDGRSGAQRDLVLGGAGHVAAEHVLGLHVDRDGHQR